MSEQLAEIKGLVEKINPTLVELRSEVDELKSRKLDLPDDVITQEKWDKMSGDITTKMQAIQDAQAKMKTALERPGTAEEKSAQEKLEAKAALDAFLRKGVLPNGDEVRGKSEAIIMPETKAMSTDVNPDGGYLVQTERVGKMITRVFETSPLRQVADVMQGSTKAIEIVIDDDEHDANRVGEGSASSDTDTAEVGLKTIVAHKYDAEPRATTEMLQDAYFDVENWSLNKAERKIARSENYDFILGNGVGRARGIMTYPAWSVNGTYESGKVEQVNLGDSSNLTAAGLINLQYSLIEDYQPGATWLMKRATFGKALQLAGNDNFYFSPVLMRDGQATMQLLGKPVLFCNDIAAVGSNALAVAYGDFSVGYTIYDRVGLQVLRDPYSNRGFMTFYITKRTGGDVTSYDAFKIGKIAS